MAQSDLTSLSRCEGQFSANPLDYGSARCFLVLPRSIPRSLIADKIAQLQEAHSDSINLELVQLYLAKNSLSYAERRQRLESLRLVAKGLSDSRAEACVLAHMLIQSSRHGQDVDQRSDLRRLSLLAKFGEDVVARVHAQALISDSMNRSEASSGDALRALGEIPVQGRRLPYYVDRTLARVKAESYRILRRFEQSKKEFEYLAWVARENGDEMTYSMAALGKSLVLLDQVYTRPTSTGVRSAINAFSKALESANASGARRAGISSLIQLGALYNRDRQDRRRLEKTVQACLNEARSLGDKVKIGLCYANRSQMLADSSPKAALRSAIDGLIQLQGSQYFGARIEVRRQAARRFWEHQQREVALDIAMSNLEMLEWLRVTEKDSVDRVQKHSKSISDYYWMISKIRSMQLSDEMNFNRAIRLGDLIRAREINDRNLDLPDRYAESARQSVNDATSRVIVEFFEAFELSQLAGPSHGTSGVVSLQRAQSELREALASKFLSEAQPKLLEEIQDVLEPSEALVLLYASKDQTIDGEPIGRALAQVVDVNGARWVDLDLSRPQIEEIAIKQRYASSLGVKVFDSVNRRALEQSFMPLLQGLSPGVKRLSIVADGPFHLVSFESMFSSWIVSRSTCVKTWLEDRTRGSNQPLSRLEPLAIVNPEISTDQALESGRKEGKLPHAMDDARAIRESLGAGTKVLHGAQARLSELLRAWNPERGLLHIGAHARTDKRRPQDSRIPLAPEAASGERTQLSWSEIQSMDFSGSVVVVGGCSTGTGALVDGEGVMSLARMFLGSHARAVIASLWDVRDDESSVFFGFFYPCVAKGEALDFCLAKAKRKTRASWGLENQTVSTDGFYLVGDANLRFAQPESKRESDLLIVLACTGISLSLLIPFLRLRRRKRSQRSDLRSSDSH